jgi:predicted DCC family thiol-disulfide oxidoreductase YuxK
MSSATAPAPAPAGLPAAPARLTILYDEQCALCRRARDWLLTQPCLVSVELLAAGSDEARERYGSVPWLGSELVVVDERGNAWVGPSAFLACMWATARYRAWAFRLSRPSLAHHAEDFFRWISKRRDRWSVRLGPGEHECSWCDDAAALRGTGVDGVCANDHPMLAGQRFCRECGLPRVVLDHQL